MHFSGRVVEGLDPTQVPPFPFTDSGIIDTQFAAERAYRLYQPPDVVNISWARTGVDGMLDTPLSRASAWSMLHAFGLCHPAQFPTKHSLGDAIDVDINWRGIVDVTIPGSAVPVKLDSSVRPKPILPSGRRGRPCLDDNPDLVFMGQVFGVQKLESDCLHWSIDGH